MTRISQIYKTAYSNTAAAISADRTLTERINREVIEPVHSFVELKENQYTDLIFAGSGIGQEQGFQEGFRYALALIFESLAS